MWKFFLKPIFIRALFYRIAPGFLAERLPVFKPEVFASEPLRTRLGSSKAALVSAAGIYAKGQVPFRTKSFYGDFSYRAILASLPSHTLLGNDRAFFPLERLDELQKNRCLGQVAERHYSFAPFCFDTELVARGSASEAAKKMRYEGVDVAILVRTTRFSDAILSQVLQALREERIAVIAVHFSESTQEWAEKLRKLEVLTPA